MRRLITLLVLGSLTGAATQAASGPAAGIDEQARGRAISVRVRLEPTHRAEPGSCLMLGPAALEITLRGKRIEDPGRIELERDPSPSVHALLLDTSRSMAGKLSLAREAARSYVQQLRVDHERAMIIGFDETEQLQQRLTDDRQALARAIDGISVGLMTAVHDGLSIALRELAIHDSRAVVVLLTDGADSGSLGDASDLFAQIDAMPQLTIFTIGLGVPPMRPDGRTPKALLQRLAARTGGHYFDAPTTSRLPRIFARMREMLDSEAVLSVIDPSPDASPGKLRVASNTPGCRVVTMDREATLAPPPVRQMRRDPRLPGRWVAAGGTALAPHGLRSRHPAARRCREEPEIAAVGDESAWPRWIIAADKQGVSGCVVDLTTDFGLLFDPWGDEWLRNNDWVWTKMRTLAFPLPAPDELPHDLVQWMDRLAAREQFDPVADNEMDPRLHPRSSHARAFHGHPALIQGRTFFDLREGLAHALFTRQDYRAWALTRLEQETRARLQRLERRVGLRAPGRTEAQVAAAVRASPEGRRIIERGAEPQSVDLQRTLAAWLGDVSAHDLFAEWERSHLDRLLRGQEGLVERAAFAESWWELRRLFHVPSHTRVLAVLAPTLEDDTIGFHRVVLPRPGLLQRRLKGYRRPAELAHTPLDLLPDLPLAYWVVGRLIDEDRSLFDVLQRAGLRPQRAVYELLGKSGSHRPGVAFRRTRITLMLQAADGRSTIRLTALLRLDRDDGTDDRPRTPFLESVEVQGVEGVRASLTSSGAAIRDSTRTESTTDS